MTRKFFLCPAYVLGALISYIAGYQCFLNRDWPYAGLAALLCGACIVGFAAEWIRNRYLRMPLHKVDRLSGESFEQYLRAHFIKKGYHVKMTAATQDYGADLILKKRGKITVVQAKRYEKNVGLAAVQEVIGAAAYYEADKCMVVTNRFFTKNAENLASLSQVELWDRNRMKGEFDAKE